VSLVDGDRVAHTVTVSASSLCEAAVLGLAEFAERLPTPSE
jgi:hypothetical protein